MTPMGRQLKFEQMQKEQEDALEKRKAELDKQAAELEKEKAALAIFKEKEAFMLHQAEENKRKEEIRRAKAVSEQEQLNE